MKLFLIIGALGGILFLILIAAVIFGCQFKDTDIEWYEPKRKTND